jgi:type IV pilus assembly protein PilE
MKCILFLSLKRKSAGFTLIEVMITVAVIGILSAIALPSYTDYIRRGKTQEATSGLANMRVKMEQYYQDNRTYASYVDASCAQAGVAVLSGKYFTYSCTSDATSYSIIADGVAAQGMGGYEYTINQNNAMTSTVPGNGVVGCWVTKRGESC